MRSDYKGLSLVDTLGTYFKFDTTIQLFYKPYLMTYYARLGFNFLP